LVRTRVDEVSSSGRNTQGVTLIKLAKDEKLVGLERVQVLADIDVNVEEAEDLPENPDVDDAPNDEPNGEQD